MQMSVSLHVGHLAVRLALICVCCVATFLCCEGVEKEVFNRYVVTQDTVFAKFVPTNLSDSVAAASLQKRAVIGAAFVGHLDQLRGSNVVRVLWEVELSPEPPAHFKPIKPKLWVMGKLSMKKDNFYKLI